jgi:hypothetical protein
MKKLAIVLLCASSGSALAADYGVGVSAKSDDAWIYAPIDVTPGFRIEPSIRFFNAKTESQQQSGPIPSTVSSQAHTREYALGLFGVSGVGESVRIYYGARGAYIDSADKTRISFGGVTTTTDYESSSDGYRISPTLGFEYVINEHFSIGGEAEWFYQDVDIDSTQPFALPQSAHSKTNGTNTHLIVRFMF